MWAYQLINTKNKLAKRSRTLQNKFCFILKSTTSIAILYVIFDSPNDTLKAQKPHISYQTLTKNRLFTLLYQPTISIIPCTWFPERNNRARSFIPSPPPATPQHNGCALRSFKLENWTNPLPPSHRSLHSAYGILYFPSTISASHGPLKLWSTNNFI